MDVLAVKNGELRILCQCKDWRDEYDVTPAEMWRLIALSYTIRARPAMVTTTELTDRAEQIARRWGVRIITPADLDSAPLTPFADDPHVERRWESRLDDGGEMQELLRRGVVDRYEQEPMY